MTAPPTRPPRAAPYAGRARQRRTRSTVSLLAVALLVPATGTAAAAPAPAAAAAPAPAAAASGAGTEVVALATAAGVPAGMLAALQRDLNLTPPQALARLGREDAAARTEQALRADLGAGFGGAWLAGPDQQLVVAITDAAGADEVRAAGARPRIVDRSERELTAAKARLDRAARPGRSIAGWYVDVASNTVVVLARPAAAAVATEFVAASGADTAVVRIVAATENPVPLHDVRGGDAYYPGSSRCSVGFSVVGGFVTAGHCGGVGTTTRGVNQVAQGTVRGSSFPTRDYGWVQANADWTPTPRVNRYSGSQTVTVTGSQEASVGASVCRSGSTTGWRCGTIEARNATVNYPQGTVFGLTRTSACAEGGDSGGSFLNGTQAQGVTSGGSATCTGTNPVTFFQPLLPILSAYGLTLVTGPPPLPPPRPPFGVLDLVKQVPGGVLVFGWAIDPDTTAPIDVHIYVDDVIVGGWKADRHRPDVGAVHPYGDHHGFDVTIQMSDGPHRVCAYAINVGTATNNVPLGCKDVTVSHLPFGSLDAVHPVSSQIVRVAGWAIDPDSADPIEVQIYLDGVRLAILTANGSRPDVGAAYPGYGNNHGFDTTIGNFFGGRTVCIVLRNVGAGTGNPIAACKQIT